jgi:hypothetical protein
LFFGFYHSILNHHITVKYRHVLFCSVIPFATLALTQCIIEEGSTSNGAPTQLPANSQAGFTQPLTAITSLGSVTIREGSRTLTSIRTASPNVEETRWYQEQEQIVVKSRGNHGPATIQLFNSRTGAQLGTVMAYEVASGGPAWASGMGE